MRDLGDAELRALAFVDDNELVRDLSDLVAVPSVSGDDAESDVLHLLAKQLRDLDLDIDLWPLDLPTLTADPDFPGWEVPRTEAWGLVATARDTEEHGDAALVLQGHVDVVPPGDLSRWDGDPFTPRLVDGRLHGRGTVDMKGGVVAMIAAVRAVRAAGLRLRRPYAVHLAVGEEDGGLGAFATLDRGHRGEACVIAEPDQRNRDHRQRRGPDVRDRGGGPGHAREHGVRRRQRVRRLPARACGPGRPATPPQRARRPAHGRVPGRLPLVGREGGMRGLGQQRARPAGGRGPAGRRARRGPEDARAELVEAVASAAAADPWLRDHPPRWRGPGVSSPAAATPATQVPFSTRSCERTPT